MKFIKKFFKKPELWRTKIHFIGGKFMESGITLHYNAKYELNAILSHEGGFYKITNIDFNYTNCTQFIIAKYIDFNYTNCTQFIRAKYIEAER